MRRAHLSTFLALCTEVEMSEREMPRNSSSGLSWIRGLHGKRHVYETGVKGQFKIAKFLLKPSVSKGLDAVGTHYVSPLWLCRAESRLRLVNNPRFSAYLRVLFYWGPFSDSY